MARRRSRLKHIRISMNVLGGVCCFSWRRSRPKQKAFPGIPSSWLRVDLLDKKREPNRSSEGKGPMATLKSLEAESLSDTDRLKWLEDTRLDAMLGATSRSQNSVRSGVRLWMAFVGVNGMSVQHVLGNCVYKSVCRQIRSAAEAVFPATVAPLDFMDNHLQKWRHAEELFGICQNRMHGVQ